LALLGFKPRQLDVKVTCRIAVGGIPAPLAPDTNASRLRASPPCGSIVFMLTVASIVSLSLLAVAAVIRSFRAVENQALLAILAGKALWAELGVIKKIYQ